MLGKHIYIILFFIIKNIQIKYKHTMLGFLWSLLQPLLYLLILVAIFTHVFQSIPNYPLYVLSGLVFWVYFSGTTNRLSGVFVANTHMIKSHGIPKYIYALTDVGSELFNFLLGLIPFMIIMYFMGLEMSFNLLYLIPIILLFSMFIFAIGIILGSLNVFFRDIGILWLALNPAFFYISPIFFTAEVIPGNVKFLVLFNPIFHFLELVRDVLYYGRPPSLHYFGTCLGITAVLSLIAIAVYRKTNKSFISNL